MEQRKQIEEPDCAKLHQATLCSDARLLHPCHRLHSILNKHYPIILSIHSINYHDFVADDGDG